MPITLVERLAFQLYNAQNLILRLDRRQKRLPLWHDLTHEQKEHYRALATSELEWLQENMGVSIAGVHPTPPAR